MVATLPGMSTSPPMEPTPESLSCKPSPPTATGSKILYGNYMDSEAHLAHSETLGDPNGTTETPTATVEPNQRRSTPSNTLASWSKSASNTLEDLRCLQSAETSSPNQSSEKRNTAPHFFFSSRTLAYRPILFFRS